MLCLKRLHRFMLIEKDRNIVRIYLHITESMVTFMLWCLHELSNWWTSDTFIETGNPTPVKNYRETLFCSGYTCSEPSRSFNLPGPKCTEHNTLKKFKISLVWILNWQADSHAANGYTRDVFTEKDFLISSEQCTHRYTLWSKHCNDKDCDYLVDEILHFYANEVCWA